MNSSELSQLLHSGKPPMLVHVLPEEVFTACRIPGSRNACVYEMAFPDQFAALADSKDAPIVVYGAGDGSCDSRVAAEKLAALGFVNVVDFSEGLAAWQAAGFPVEGDGCLPQAPLLDGGYVLNTHDSLIRWTGRNLFNHHHGTLRLGSGEIVIAAGVLQSARFVIDMNSIACEDLTDEAWNAMLIRHLRDADFFDAVRFPTSEFTVRRADPIAGCTDGTPNHLLDGELTVRGVTRALAFPAVIATADGERLTGQAQVEIDRTEFGSIYGSGKFFRCLGKHVVNDHIQLHLKIHADRVSG